MPVASSSPWYVPAASDDVVILTSIDTVLLLFVRVPEEGESVVNGKRMELFSALATYTRFQLSVFPVPRPFALRVMNLSRVPGPM